MIGELLDAGLLHPDTRTVAGDGLGALHPGAEADRRRAGLGRGRAARRSTTRSCGPPRDPFQPTGGMRRLKGNLGTGVMKVSAVAPERHVDRGAGAGLPRPGGGQAGVPGRRVHRRHRGRGALPGAEGQRHAGAAQPDAGARGAAGPRAEGGAGHRRADVGRVAARCPRRSTSAPRRSTAGRWRGCTTATVVRVDAVAGTLDVLTPGVLERPNVRPDLVANGYGRRARALRRLPRHVGPAEAGASPLF